MRKIKLLITLLILGLSFGASAQKMKLGSSIISFGFDYCLYSGSSTNLCTLTGASASMQGFEYSLSYDYVVLDHLTINANGGLNLLPGGTAIDAGVGVEYHIHYTHHIDPFDIYIHGNTGYSHLSYAGGLLSTSGTFNAAGLYYMVGFGARRYLIHDVGVFLNVQYGGHKYSGGEKVKN
jgi:hypothetical protein